MPLTSTARRTLMVLGVAAVLAAPAVVLRALCAGRACDRPTAASTRVPFCSLPSGLRAQLEAGFRDGRSPDLLAVTGSQPVEGSSRLRGTGTIPAWPSTTHPEPEEVPVVFWGAGVTPGPIEGPHTLADVAPTLAAVIGLDRPHPGVRSGTEIPGVAAGADPPRLVLEVILEGVGTDDLERNGPPRWANLARLMDEGAATSTAATGSQPLDPAATMATIGTGGLPSEHGITGTLLRNDEGRLVEAWGPGAPFSVIATLGDDLDELNDQRPLIGLVASDTADRGLTGGNWYLDNDRDDFNVSGGPPIEVLGAFLQKEGYGEDDATDFLAVVLDGSIPVADDQLEGMVQLVRDAVGDDFTVVVVGTGSTPRRGSPTGALHVQREVEGIVGADVIEATGVGGLFLDQEALTDSELTRDDVLQALRELRASPGEPLFADTFSSVAVSLARYC
jgi:Type I phosphodiesterase / nucleotide pyrophosphatase